MAVLVCLHQENSVSAIMQVFFDNANCVELRSLENSFLWSTLNLLKTIKRKTPMYKQYLQSSTSIIGNEMTFLEIKQLENAILQKCVVKVLENGETVGHFTVWILEDSVVFPCSWYNYCCWGHRQAAMRQTLDVPADKPLHRFWAYVV